MVRQGQGRSSTWSSTTASHTPHRRFSLAAYVSFVADFSFTRSLSWHAFATSNSSNLGCGTFPREYELPCTGTGNRSFGEKTVKKNQLRYKIRTTESDFESFMEDNGRGQWGR